MLIKEAENTKRSPDTVYGAAVCTPFPACTGGPFNGATPSQGKIGDTTKHTSYELLTLAWRLMHCSQAPLAAPRAQGTLGVTYECVHGAFLPSVCPRFFRERIPLSTISQL